MLTTGSKVIHIMGPPAVPMGIPVTFTCSRMHTPDSIVWKIYYIVNGSTQSVTTLLGVDLKPTHVNFNFTTINDSTSQLVLNTNRSIISIECSARDGSGILPVSSINVTVYGKFCLFIGS